MSAKKNSAGNITRKIVMHFPREQVNRPLVCHLAQDFNLTFNILRANVNPNEQGTLVLELSGRAVDFRRGLKYLQGNGVTLQPLSRDISWDEKRCTHCGACLAFCPSSAFAMEESSMLILFNKEKCIACELCLKACPPRAMVIKL